ncbi:MAG: hypothetical protein GF346_04810 [Candidatus Eisenbacteria bacterium]|nr:hypothetical protein [Candidatus Latescibacterota bacterium]MBD3301747.1 hypothetical protein [Candidatus Eisenbacteria bacterium]
MIRIPSHAALLLLLALAGCGGGEEAETLLELPISGPDAVPAEGGAVYDPDETADGDGSLRIEAADTTTVFLHDAGAFDLDDAVLSYGAMLRSADLEGSAYLEMHVRLPRGEYLARTAASPLTGTTEWVSRRTGYVLDVEEKPERVRLFVTIHGRGTVWIDAISLTREPRP